MKKLLNKKVIITGANQGLGLAIAKSFIEEGANIFIGARDFELLKKECENLSQSLTTGQALFYSPLDVSNLDSIISFIDKVSHQWDSLDVLINNAGIYGPKASVEKTDLKEWAKTISINLLGTVFMCQASIPLLKKSNSAKIINLSGGGATSPLPNLSAYAASKAGVVRFTETLAEELRENNIEVNAVAPGALNTRLLDEIIEAGPDKVGKEFYEKSQIQKNNGGTPLSKASSLCVYLASEDSNGITGKLISAVWDHWQNFDDKFKQNINKNDIYTLRRIIPEDRAS